VVSFTLRALYPKKLAINIIEWEAKCVLDIVWTLRRREKLLVPAENEKRLLGYWHADCSH